VGKGASDRTRSLAPYCDGRTAACRKGGLPAYAAVDDAGLALCHGNCHLI